MFGQGVLATMGSGAAIVLAWNALRLLLQVVWLISIARALGAANYGVVAGLSGLAAAVAGFGAFGLGLKLYRDIARNPSLLPAMWPEVRWASVASALVLFPVFVLLARWTLEEDAWVPLLALGLSEVAVAPLVTQAAFVCAGSGRLGWAAACPTAPAFGRVSAVLLFIAADPTLDLKHYCLAHALLVCVCAFGAWMAVHRALRLPRSRRAPSRESAIEGFGFAGLWASGLVSQTLDKFAVLSVGGATIAGEYSAGQRIAAVLFMPLEALVTVVLPRVFRAGGGAPIQRREAILLVICLGIYGVLGASTLWVAAPMIPVLLGPDFLALAANVHLLAFYFFASCIRVVAVNLLLGLDLKRLRVVAELTACCSLIAILIWLGAGQSLERALVAMLCSEILGASLSVAFLFGAVLKRRGKQPLIIR